MSGVGGIGPAAGSHVEAGSEAESVEPTGESAEPGVALAMAPPSSRAVSRSERVAEDVSTLASVAAKLALLGDPLALRSIAQAWIRELRVEVREGSAEAADSAATSAAETRDAMLREAERLAAEASTASDISRVFSIVGAAISLAVGTIGAVFSGGATLIAAIGLAIAVLGPLVTSELARAGALDANVATGIGLGCAVVGSIMSFGAGSGSAVGAGVDAGVKVAVQVTTTALKVAAAAVQAASGGADIASAAYVRESAHRDASADEAEVVRETSRDEVEAAHEDIVDFVREAAREAERLRAVVEARNAAMRAVTGARA